LILAAQDLSLMLGPRTLFEGLNFSLQSGERLVIRGPSGAGKTSLLKCLTKEIYPSSGGFTVWPQNWAEIPQHLSLNDELSAEENVCIGLLRGAGFRRQLFPFPAAFRKQAKEALTKLGIQSPNEKVRNLSGGERQRVAVARALLAPWDVLFADEPVSHLDDRWAQKVLELLSAEAKRREGALVLVLHQEALANKFGTKHLPIEGDQQPCDR
jgi:ABC-type phosphate/phosphonate transport system ATPase subunit